MPWGENTQFWYVFLKILLMKDVFCANLMLYSLILFLKSSVFLHDRK